MCYFQFQGAEIGPGMTADGIAVGGVGQGVVREAESKQVRRAARGQ